MDNIDDKICPLCGKANNCQVESGNCWCMETTVPKELLKKVPADKKDKACICKECIDKYNKGVVV